MTKVAGSSLSSLRLFHVDMKLQSHTRVNYIKMSSFLVLGRFLRAKVHQIRRHRVQYGVMVQRVVKVHRLCAAWNGDGTGPRRGSEAVEGL